MNNTEYNSLQGIRRSDLWVINQTPAHFRWHMDHPEEPTSALIFGQAAHKYILEPETFNEEFAIAPVCDRRTKLGKQVYEDFVSELGDRQVVTLADMEMIGDMKRALIADPAVAELFASRKDVERVFTWVDGETGEWCKVKADMICELNGQICIIDYKTTGSCADGSFERSVRKYGYDFQAGMYVEGANINLMDDCEFIFIAQEKTAPYVPRVYYCDRGFVDHGKSIFHELLRKYHECKKQDLWLGYPVADLYAEEWL